uniref:Uncharacterized protein n=1 Tax=viral metagenome TaxID=1070528 RepID=A0A6M3JEL6_9ZZZZ
MQVQVQKQQGDVNIVTIDAFPEINEYSTQTVIETGVVQEGTATGHSHRIVGTKFKLFRQHGLLFADIISENCKMVHEEHESIELEPGKYEFVRTAEYDHFAEESRRVMD